MENRFLAKFNQPKSPGSLIHFFSGFEQFKKPIFKCARKRLDQISLEPLKIQEI